MPLATLLPIIIAGLGTAVGTTTGIVKAVKDVNEQNRHNQELEKIARDQSSIEKDGNGFETSIQRSVKLRL